MSTPDGPAVSGQVVPPRSYLQGGPVEFGEAIRYGLRNWLVYRGRASRSAYWWFILFQAIVTFALALVVAVIAGVVANLAAANALIAVLVVVSVTYLTLAWLALAVRRLHDTGKSGWWVLIELVPFMGQIIFLVHMLSKGTPGPNRYDLAAAGALRPRCLECGTETAAGTQVCARCGAPVVYQPPMADVAAGGPVSSLGLPNELAGQRTRPGSGRNALVITGAGLGALAAVIVVVALATSPTSPTSRVPSSASLSSPKSSSSPASSSTPASSLPQLTEDQLRPGDCLQGRDLGLGTNNLWPAVFTAVPCTQLHTAEVFFAGNIWPQSLAAYPGDNKVAGQADSRCASAFAAYDGVKPDNSAFSYDFVIPDSYSWTSGDRLVVCVAYEPTAKYPGGAPVGYSIKGSQQ